MYSTSPPSISAWVNVEPFVFACFDWSAAEFRAGGATYVPEQIGFNPYEGDLDFSGEMVLVDPDLPQERFERLDLEGDAVVTVKTDSPLA